MNINLAIIQGAKVLSSKLIRNSYLDSEILMAKTINKDRSYILLNSNDILNKKDQNKLNSSKQPRPEIKEKPTFSTFKQLHQHHNIVRTASLSDLLDDVEEDEEISRINR